MDGSCKEDSIVYIYRYRFLKQLILALWCSVRNKKVAKFYCGGVRISKHKSREYSVRILLYTTLALGAFRVVQIFYIIPGIMPYGRESLRV